jgi:hypothetical protein
MIAATSTNEVPTMPYVRISIARPRPGQERRLEELQAQVAAFNARQPGCQQSWALHPHDESGDIARISIWAPFVSC